MFYPPQYIHHLYANCPPPFQLCMPEGLVFKKNLPDPSTSTFHTFLVTRENGTHSYGNVLTFHEPVKNAKILNVLESLQQKYIEKKRVPISSEAGYCFSRDKDQLYSPKCLCLITSEPIHEPFKVYLKQLYAVTVGRQVTPLPVESYLYNLLFEVPMPSPGKQVKFSGM